MQKTLVTFNLTLILKVRMLDIPKLWRNTGRFEKKFTYELFNYLHVHGS